MAEEGDGVSEGSQFPVKRACETASVAALGKVITSPPGLLNFRIGPEAGAHNFVLMYPTKLAIMIRVDRSAWRFSMTVKQTREHQRLSRILIGVLWFGAALIAQVINYYVYDPISTENLKDQEGYLWFIFVFGKIHGFTSIAIICLVTGLSYLVIYPIFIAPFVSRVGDAVQDIYDSIYQAFANIQMAVPVGFTAIAKAVADVAPGTKYEMIRRWIRNHEGTDQERKAIAVAAFEEHYGAHTADKRSYLHYVVSHFLDKSAIETGYWYENYSLDITVRPIVNPDEWSRKFLFWDETRDYTLKCPSGEGIYPYRVTSWLQVGRDDCLSVLNRQALVVTANKKEIFNLGKRLSKLDESNLSTILSEGGYSEDGLRILHDGANLRIVFEQKYKIESDETKFVISEDIFLNEADRSYNVGLLRPAKIMTIKFGLEGDELRDWVVTDADVSPRRYHREGEDLVWSDPRYPVGVSQKIHIQVSEWVLPGIVAVLAWGPKS